MNRAIKLYRRQVARRLTCAPRRRRRLLRELDGCLASYLEDVPSPDLAQLSEAFGAPPEMAGSLMEGIPQRERDLPGLRLPALAIAALALVSIVALALIVHKPAGGNDGETVVFSFSNAVYDELISSDDELDVTPSPGGVIDAKKVRTIKYMDTEIAKITLHAVFSLDGKTVSVTGCDHAVDSLESGWTLDPEPVVSENGVVSLKANVSNPDSGSVSFTMTLTCDPTGSVS